MDQYYWIDIFKGSRFEQGEGSSCDTATKRPQPTLRVPRDWNDASELPPLQVRALGLHTLYTDPHGIGLLPPTHTEGHDLEQRGRLWGSPVLGQGSAELCQPPALAAAGGGGCPPSRRGLGSTAHHAPRRSSYRLAEPLSLPQRSGLVPWAAQHEQNKRKELVLEGPSVTGIFSKRVALSDTSGTQSLNSVQFLCSFILKSL